MRIPFTWLFALLLMASAAKAQTVILVRHAERGGGMDGDAGLSEMGHCRAGILAAMLADAGIRRAFVTDVARTQQTAAPIAQKLKLTPEVLPALDYDGLVKRLRSGAGNALVVGHSNTVPEIVSRLGGGTIPPVADTEYDRLIVVTLQGAGAAPAVTLRYRGCEQ